MKENKLNVTVGVLLFLVILGIGAFYRLSYLSLMAYHHDESIHVHYSHQLYRYGPGAPQLGKSSPPYYSAVYHGPFNYHLGALFFVLSGVSDFTGRLPYAVYGIVMLWIAYLLKVEIGQRKALLAMLLCAVSPVLTYFSRFARNDVLLGTDNLAMLTFALLYFHSGKARYFLLAVLAAIFGYCTKENSYVGGAVLCSFLVAYCVARMLPAVKPRLMKGILLIAAVVVAVAAAIFAPGKQLKALAFPTVLVGFGLLYFVYCLIRDAFPSDEPRRDFAKKVFSKYWVFTFVIILYGIFSAFIVFYVDMKVRHAWFPKGKGAYTFWIYWGTGLLLTLAVFYTLLFLRMRYLSRKETETETPAPSITRVVAGDIGLLFAVLITIVGVYTVLFTVCFTKWRGMTDGVYLYLSYWLQMHGKPRIPGPSTYYVIRMILYEPLAMLGLAFALVYYPCRIGIRWFVRREPELAEKYPYPSWFPLFFIFWSVFSLWIYSILEEKVQWLLYHQALPCLVLTGYLIGELHERMRPGAMRKLLWGVVSLLLMYQVRATTLCTHFEPDDPRELLVYTQTNSDVMKVLKEIEQYSHVLQGRGEKVIIQTQGETTWPFIWYLRNYETRSGIVTGQDVPIILTDLEQKSRMRAVLEDNFIGRQYRLRAWWQPGQSWSDMSHSKEWFSKLWRWIIYREPWDGEKYIGSTDFMFYVRRDLLPGATLPPQLEEPDMTPINPKMSSSQPKPLELIATWGGAGSGEGQLSLPRGLALSPAGTLYVADSRNHRVQAFDTSGKFLFAWGSAGSGDSQFNEPSDVAFGPDSSVWVTDLWNNRLQRFNAQGEFRQAVVSSSGVMYGPRSVTLTHSSEAFAVDTGNKRVIHFNSAGGYRGEWGSKGTRTGRFDEPVGIVCGPDGNIYVADTGNKRIQVFEPSEPYRCLNLWNVPGWSVLTAEPYLAFGPGNSLYATDASAGRILRFSSDGQNVDIFSLPSGSGAELTRPTGIAVASDGTIFVSDRDRSQILKLKPIEQSDQ